MIDKEKLKVLRGMSGNSMPHMHFDNKHGWSSAKRAGASGNGDSKEFLSDKDRELELLRYKKAKGLATHNF